MKYLTSFSKEVGGKTLQLKAQGISCVGVGRGGRRFGLCVRVYVWMCVYARCWFLGCVTGILSNQFRFISPKCPVISMTF